MTADQSDDDLRTLARRATPGPWTAGDGTVFYRNGNAGGGFIFDLGDADAAFIAAANPTRILALLDKTEAYDALRAAILEHHYDDYGMCHSCVDNWPCATFALIGGDHTATLARLRADTLREAADAFDKEGLALKPGGWASSPADQQTIKFALAVKDWLRDRADHIEGDTRVPDHAIVTEPTTPADYTNHDDEDDDDEPVSYREGEAN